MATKLIRPQTTYQIEGLPVYDALEVSSGSKDNLTVPKAFEFAQKAGGRLQSLGEALAVRVAFYTDNKETDSGLDGSENYQRTKTVSLKFLGTDGKPVVAFMELDDAPASKKLVQECYDANRAGNNLIKPVKDGFICDLIAHAKDAGRIVPALANNPLKLTTAQANGKSAYGQHPNVIAAFGNVELAELNASYLGERGYKTGQLWDYTAKELESELKGKEDSAIVRAVALGGDDYNVGIVNAYDYFGNGGRARAVVPVGAQKISTGNKGRSKAHK